MPAGDPFPFRNYRGTAMHHISPWFLERVPGNRWLLRIIALVVLAGALPLGFPQRVHAADNPQVLACKANSCVSFCKDLGVTGRQLTQCIAQCRSSCAPGDPPPITVKPKYLIVALVYAPPGCTNGPSGSPARCGTSNGSSFVDYNSSSANGNKVTVKDSFQLGVTISYDASGLGILGGGGSYGFSRTQSDSSSVNVTKSQSFDLKVAGNGDGVDHGQDFFVLLLGPTVTLKKHGDQIQWSFTDGGDLYEVYVAELRRPASMRPSTKAVLGERGFTTADYQAILSQNPFGGNVCTAPALQCSVMGTNSGMAVMDGHTAAPANDGLDPHRFWLTGQTFPYQPAINLPNCNGGICNCPVVSNAFVNDKLTNIGTEDTSQTTVDLHASAGIASAWSLKLDTKMTWTTTGTTDNSTDSKQSATATLTCPSTAYTGPSGMKVYWDSRYGSFVFVPYDPGSTALIHQGTVVDANGHPIAGQLVTLSYGGKNQRTYTAPDGTYRFPSPTGKKVLAGTAQIVTGDLKQTINLGASRRPAVFRMMHR